jgi:hypothetical protein
MSNDIELTIKQALGEVLNLAAAVADLQASDTARTEMYALLDLVAKHYGLEYVEQEDHSHPDLSANDEDGLVVQMADPTSEEQRPAWISLAVDNSHKKMH